MLIYDITNEDSYEHVRVWKANIDEHAKANIPIILIGNKCDMVEQSVTPNGGVLATQFQCPFYMTSAKTGENIEKVFQQIAKMILEGNVSLHNQVRGVSLTEPIAKEERNCC